MTLTTLKRKKMLTRMETIEGIAKKYTLFPCSKVFSLGLLKGHGNLVHPAKLVFIRQPEYTIQIF